MIKNNGPDIAQLENDGRASSYPATSPGFGALGPYLEDMRINMAQKPLPVNIAAGEAVPYNVLAFDFNNVVSERLINIHTNLLYFVWTDAVPGVNPVLLVRVGDLRNDQIPLSPGVGIRGLGSDKVYISTAGGVACTGKLLILYDRTLNTVEVT